MKICLWHPNCLFTFNFSNRSQLQRFRKFALEIPWGESQSHPKVYPVCVVHSSWNLVCREDHQCEIEIVVFRKLYSKLSFANFFSIKFTSTAETEHAYKTLQRVFIDLLNRNGHCGEQTYQQKLWKSPLTFPGSYISNYITFLSRCYVDGGLVSQLKA